MMLLNVVSLFLVFAVSSGCTDVGWVQIPGGLADISVAADGSVWGVNSADYIYELYRSPTGKEYWRLMTGRLNRISVGRTGLVYGVASDQSIWKLGADGNSWIRLPGALNDIGVGRDGSVWGVTNNNAIYRLDGSTWTLINGGLSQIDVGDSERVIGTAAWAGGPDSIWRGPPDSAGTWAQIPGGLVEASIASDGSVWGVNRGGNIYRLGFDGAWTQICGAATVVDVGRYDLVYLVNSAGNIFRASKPMAGLAAVPPALPDTFWSHYEGLVGLVSLAMNAVFLLGLIVMFSCKWKRTSSKKASYKMVSIDSDTDV